MKITIMNLLHVEVSPQEAEELQEILEDQPQRMLDHSIIVAYTWDMHYEQHPVIDAIIDFAAENDIDFAEVHIFSNRDEIDD